MNEKMIRDILMELLCRAVNGQPGDPALNEKLTPEVIGPVYRLARKHSLAHLVSGYVFANGFSVEPEEAARFQQADILRVYKHEQMKYAFAEICAAFDEAQIAYIPLKGAVLRGYYPEESMRTSCDIDVLVHEEELERAAACLTDRGYRRGERHYHDISLFSPNGTHLELHFSVQENMEQLDCVLREVWDYAVAGPGSRYDLREDFFVFYIYAHAAYHFLDGGCGIRTLADIWVMERRMGAGYGCAEKLLKRAGLYRFASEISKVANQCFTRHDATDPVMDYIWRGGVYGNRKNRISVQTRQPGSSRAYLLRRLVPPYRSMVIGYPVLRRVPILLPLCWVHRWFRAAFGRRSARLRTELGCVNDITPQEQREAREICLRLGL